MINNNFERKLRQENSSLERSLARRRFKNVFFLRIELKMEWGMRDVCIYFFVYLTLMLFGNKGFFKVGSNEKNGRVVVFFCLFRESVAIFLKQV